jgi:Cu(I)/Ag(I) efflux system membrane fusion protein
VTEYSDGLAEPKTPVDGTSNIRNDAKEPPPSPPPPRGPRLRLILVVLIPSLLTLSAGIKWSNEFGALWEKIHPAKAIEIETQTSEAGKTQYYTCGMHPWVILPKPGDCPICHMKLVPLDPSKFIGEIAINPVITQDIGVRIAPVTSGEVTRTIRTIGSVDYNETLVRDVNLKISGWVTKLYADYVGEPVQKGEPLLDIYSPELYSAQEEYLQAYRHATEPASARAAKDVSDVAKWNADLLEAAGKRLEYFDISAEQIRELETTGTVSKTLTLRSPYSGLVIQKMAYEGMKVDGGMRLYRIADLSHVWVMVTLYEYQLPYVQLGQQAIMSLPYTPGQTFTGSVTYIYPYLNQKLRQVNVRLEFDNPNLSLKPGMFANIELRSTLAQDRVLVPREAVIDTGERQVAFVSLGEGKFEARNVKLGVTAEGGQVEILDGLRPGEMVVTSGQFLLDSEARLREGLAKMIKGNLASEQEVRAAAAGTTELTSLPQAAQKGLISALDNYFVIGSKLAGDTTDGIADPSRKLAADIDALLPIEIPENPHFWQKHAEVAAIRGKVLELIDAKDLAKARLLFADLSTSLDKLLKATGVPPAYGKEVQELHCPMYREGQGGTWWLQVAGNINNPYLGSQMPQCHDKLLALPVTGTQAAASEPASRPAMPSMTSMPPVQSQPSGVMPAALKDATQLQVDRLTGAYLDIQSLLASDKTDGIERQLAIVADAAESLTSAASLKSVADRISAAAGKKTAGIDEMRLNNKDLSEAVVELVKLAPPSAKVAPTLYQIHCPMTKADWLQTTQNVANPYYGKAMLTCGSVVATIHTAPAGEK